jgi:hypothetical protein
MQSLRPLKLSRLRDIGWSSWDPIGMLADGEEWDQKSFADEYDSYLLTAAGHLRRDSNLDKAVDYLVRIESDHMGLGLRPSSRSRAEATARALLDYVKSLEQP